MHIRINLSFVAAGRLLALVILLGVGGSGLTSCANVDDYSVWRAEERWSASVGAAQKGLTFMDLERAIRQRSGGGVGGTVMHIEDRFSEAMKPHNAGRGIADAARTVAENERLQKFNREYSIAGAAHALSKAQGR